MKLRPYQMRAQAAVFKQWETVGATAVIHATGLGKSVLAASIIQQLAPKRVLFLAHRRELIMQPKEKLKTFADIEADVEMGEYRAVCNLWGKKQVVVSSVQTQFAAGGSRQFNPTDFDYLILDEMHHYVGAPAFRGVVEHYRKNPNLKILGLTATPKRTDKQAMRQIFESVADSYEICPAIRDGWLVNIKPEFVPVSGLDYSHIDLVAKELNGKQLAEVLDREEIVQRMIQPTVELAWGCPPQTLSKHPVAEWKAILDTYGEPLRTLIFCANVNQATMFANILNRIHDGLAAMVCGEKKKVSEERREQIGRDFKTGSLRFVANVDVYSEGYDNPYLQMLVMARPLKSPLKYTQCLGRGTRPWPGVVEDLEPEPGVFVELTVEERLAAIAASKKPFLKVVDFVGVSGRHKILNCVDALGGEMDEATVERAIKAAKDGKPQLVSELLKKSAEEIRAEQEERDRQEEARKHKWVAKSVYVSVPVNAFDASTIKPVYEVAVSKCGKEFTANQAWCLRKNGTDPARVTYPQGQAIIAKIKARPPSDKQQYWLRRAGYSNEEIMKFTKATVKPVMDYLFANNLRRPPTAPVKPFTPPPPKPEPPPRRPPEDLPPQANLGGWR